MSLLCNLLDISARGNHYLCSPPARHTGRASSGHSGHSVLVGGRARAHAHEKAASSQSRLSSSSQPPGSPALPWPVSSISQEADLSACCPVHCYKYLTSLHNAMSRCDSWVWVCVTGLRWSLTGHWLLAPEPESRPSLPAGAGVSLV